MVVRHCFLVWATAVPPTVAFLIRFRLGMVVSCETWKVEGWLWPSLGLGKMKLLRKHLT